MSHKFLAPFCNIAVVVWYTALTGTFIASIKGRGGLDFNNDALIQALRFAESGLQITSGKHGQQ